MPAWKKAQKPLYSASKSLKKMMDTETPVVLIDVRAADNAKANHIKGAISIPGDSLAAAKEMFPANKSAPIVLYGADTKAGLDFFSVVRGWGYKNTSVLKGGFAGWQKGELPVEAGDTPLEKIVYIPKPKAGSVDIASFSQAIDSKTTDIVILDVRTDDETEAGKIAEAIAIPAEEVVDRLDEIPKDKQVFIHCSTGIRAEMAYIALKEKGYQAKFLDANITVADSGTYEITVKE
jgi:rhodanese-related sulfurtransferase